MACCCKLLVPRAGYVLHLRLLLHLGLVLLVVGVHAPRLLLHLRLLLHPCLLLHLRLLLGLLLLLLGLLLV